MVQKIYPIQRQEKALIELERVIGEGVPRVDDLQNVSSGIMFSGNKIIGIKLQNKGLDRFPKIINDFRYLEILDLSHNPMKKTNPIPFFDEEYRGTLEPDLNPKWMEVIPIKCVDLKRVVLSNTSLQKDALKVFNSRFPTIISELEIPPSEIKERYLKNLISEQNAVEMLIDVVENSDSSYYRLESLNILKDLKIQGKKVASLLESCTFDENPLIVAKALEYLVNVVGWEKLQLYLAIVRSIRFDIFLDRRYYRILYDLLNAAKEVDYNLYRTLRKELHNKMLLDLPYKPKFLVYIWGVYCCDFNKPHLREEDRDLYFKERRELTDKVSKRGRIGF